MFKKLSIKDRLYHDKNIYLALYSVESYIYNKELLSKADRDKLIKLRDKFDWKNIKTWIQQVRKRLKEVVDGDAYLNSKVYFKPKKYDDDVIFRPIHTASLLDQIVAVAMLNVLIYDFDDQDKISMSNLSRLIPYNFYGNRVAYEPECLYKPWNTQYKKYTSMANEMYRKYHENHDYKWEVSLDLENFFPTINPVSLINYIDQQLPVDYEEEERKLVNKILEKLIFVELEPMCTEDLQRYTGEVETKQCRFAIGLPQGLPQCYFLANLFMVNLQFIYKKNIPGEMLFYVDDSVIFTNSIENISELDDKIKSINEEIKAWAREMYIPNNYISKDVKNFVKQRLDYFNVHIHEPGDKSTISNVSNSKAGEIYIHCIGREASKTAFEINTSYSDEESNMLMKKSKIILEVIEAELEDNDKKIESGKLDKEEERERQSYKKKLIRYKKFFKNRNRNLEFRGEYDVRRIKEELLQDLKFLENTDDVASLKEFFEKYNEDTLGINIKFVLKAMRDANENISEIVNLIEKLNKRLFKYDNKESSYVYKMYNAYIDDEEYDDVNLAYMRVNPYSRLLENVKKVNGYINNKTDSVCLRRTLDILDSINDGFSIATYTNKKFADVTGLVTANSDVLQRMVLNACFSNLLKIEISDDVVLQKTNNRKITYFELRLLAFLRNKHFSFKQFISIISDIKKDEYQYCIDYSIMQVLGIFNTFVGLPECIDNLILVHKYTCDIWKNGSKHLYFYTLHNQEHAVDLIQNSIKILRAIDYIDISRNDYYVLFIACYLHDISMVTLPDLGELQRNSYETNKIYSDFLKDVCSKLKQSKCSKSEVLKLLENYYMRVDSFYEKLARSNHPKDSATEIRNRKELDFIDVGLREVVAEVSEAHGYDVVEIYNVKSTAGSKLWSKKFTKIVLRLADLLDMSSYRVSQLILEHNLDNMGTTSRFHWLSHLAINGYELDTNYYLVNRQDFLKKGSIVENIILKVKVDMPQMTRENSAKCHNAKLESVEGMQIKLKCGMECDGKNCNFICKWFAQKNEYLFAELSALQRYLNLLKDNYFRSTIEVCIESSSKNALTSKQFTLLKEYVGGNK